MNQDQENQSVDLQPGQQVVFILRQKMNSIRNIYQDLIDCISRSTNNQNGQIQKIFKQMNDYTIKDVKALQFLKQLKCHISYSNFQNNYHCISGVSKYQQFYKYIIDQLSQDNYSMKKTIQYLLNVLNCEDLNKRQKNKSLDKRKVTYFRNKLLCCYLLKLIQLFYENGKQFCFEGSKFQEVIPLLIGQNLDLKKRRSQISSKNKGQQLIQQTQEDLPEVQQPAQQVEEPIQQVEEPIQQVEEPIQQVEEPIQQLEEPIQQVEEPIQQLEEPILYDQESMEQTLEDVPYHNYNGMEVQLEENSVYPLHFSNFLEFNQDQERIENNLSDIHNDDPQFAYPLIADQQYQDEQQILSDVNNQINQFINITESPKDEEFIGEQGSSLSFQCAYTKENKLRA